MAQVQRPMIIQSQFIRLCCPRNASRIPPITRLRQLRSLHTRHVTDNDIQRLASLPLHPLTLEDLVKYDYSQGNTRKHTDMISLSPPDTVALFSQRNSSSPPLISPFRSCPRVSPTVYNPSETYPSLSSRTHTSPKYTRTTYILYPLCCHGRKRRSHASRTRSSSPR